MKNNFTANILLCEKFKSNGECERFFNNITLEGEKNATFDLGIFLSAHINCKKREMFLVNLIYEGDERNEGGQFHPLGTYTREFDNVGKSSDLIIFRDNKVDFRWSGLYTIEFRLCKQEQDINELEIEQLIEFIEESELINSFIFEAELK